MQTRQLTFWQYVLIGFLLVFGGWLYIFLTVIRVIQPSFIPLFLAYGASIAGVMVGMVGATQYVYKKRKERETREVWEGGGGQEQDRE